MWVQFYHTEHIHRAFHCSDILLKSEPWGGPSATASLIPLLVSSWSLRSWSGSNFCDISTLLRHVPCLQSQTCDLNSVFSDVWVVCSLKVTRAQWEGQNSYKRALTQLYIHTTHFALFTFNVPSNLNTLNGKCWKKNSIWEKKDIYSIFGFVFIHTRMCFVCIHTAAAAAAAKSLQSCPTLCDPIDGSPPGSPIPGILQARTLEWVILSPMNESKKWKWSCSVVSDLWDPMDCSLPGSSVHGIFQARGLEWGATAVSNTHPYIHTYVYACIGVYTHVYREHVHAHLRVQRFCKLIQNTYWVSQNLKHNKIQSAYFF